MALSLRAQPFKITDTFYLRSCSYRVVLVSFIIIVQLRAKQMKFVKSNVLNKVL